MTEVMTLRLGTEVIRELDTLYQDEEKDRSAVVRELLEKGLHERKIAKALKQYEQGNVTLWKAASLAE
ncbi:MAG: hypothetical protein Q7K43_05670, partial [Candidatus Woesearchaeota archaeon]|nr:hypothetical protein [Candidatus Woesearchaeota archaeon]